MERMPLLSVIVPVYNTKEYLSRCMESLTHQKCTGIEILLVDDGSQDGSGALCDSYAQREENVIVIHQENQGLGFARNAGLNAARGQYVTFLDSDDYVDEDMYACLIGKMISEGADAAFCDFCHVKKDGTRIGKEATIREGVYSGAELAAAMLGAAPQSKADFDFDMSVCKGVYSRKVIEENNIRFCSERKTICEDLIFNLAYLSKAADVVYIKKSFYYYCENEGSLTHRYIAGRLCKEKQLYEQVLAAAQWLTEQQRLRFHRLFLARVRMTIRQEVFRSQKTAFGEQLKAIRGIAEDDLVQAVIRGYPIGQNPIKLRVFHTFLKRRWVLGMYILIRLNG